VIKPTRGIWDVSFGGSDGVDVGIDVGGVSLAEISSSGLLGEAD
jgi:hypothetical protein